MRWRANGQGRPAVWRALAVVAALAVLGMSGASGAARAEEGDELRRLAQQVEELRREIAELKSQAAAEARLAELERRVDLVAGELEKLRLGEAMPAADTIEHGLGPAASKIYRTQQGLSIGGYGEMLYEGADSTRDDGAGSGRVDQVDFLRAIVYFGYKFNDRLLFNSEIEWEHAKTGAGNPGEVAVEFAYLDYLWRPQANLRGGLLLVPMGFLNELHEPTVFLGARRPGVESAILPSTWRENGFGLFGDLGPWSYRTYVVNGLDAGRFAAGGLRNGRQNGARAKAQDFAWVGRFDYTGLPGLLAGGSLYVGDSGQGLSVAGKEIAAGTRILELHGEWRGRGLELRGLWARADLDDVATLNRALGLSGGASVGERLSGGYLQAGYDLFSLWRHGPQALVPYARWEAYDTQEEVPAGFARNPANDIQSLTLGLAYRPIDQVILKLDYQDLDNGARTGVDQINLALGYIF
jgi:hypothetical protein